MKTKMNQRIRELAEQAGFQYIRDEGIGWAGNYNSSLPKFAELLLQEVMNIFGDERISLHYLEQPCCEDSVYLLQSKIKEHFGIE